MEPHSVVMFFALFLIKWDQIAFQIIMLDFLFLFCGCDSIYKTIAILVPTKNSAVCTWSHAFIWQSSLYQRIPDLF